MRRYEHPAVTLIGGFRDHTNGGQGCKWEWIGCGWC